MNSGVELNQTKQPVLELRCQLAGGLLCFPAFLFLGKLLDKYFMQHQVKVEEVWHHILSFGLGLYDHVAELGL